MRAEAVSWNDYSVSNPPPMADDDKWHVELAPNEVKVVSLEQLDDLFRLSIVDSETKVWQAGMSDWQPLRVIAGLEEQPKPKRTPPRPPAPPARAGSATVRLETRPAPPPARPAYVAPASFYPEPISAYPAAQTAPIAFAAPMHAMNSVRPLVVSHAPPVAQRRGGGFGRFLVGVALLAGVGITAYRNDFVRDGAHAAHQDALYARLEAALGGPAFGTVRALEQSAASPGEPEVSLSDELAVRTAGAVPSAPAPSSAAQTNDHSTGAAGATPPVVSLESLAPEQKRQPATKLEAAAPAAVAPAPARAAASFVQPKPVAASAPAKAPPVRAAATPKPAVEKPAPVAQKPASEMTERERLNAAIGQSMMQSAPPKSKGNKSKSKASEYDPLNPTL